MMKHLKSSDKYVRREYLNSLLFFFRIFIQIVKDLKNVWMQDSLVFCVFLRRIFNYKIHLIIKFIIEKGETHRCDVLPRPECRDWLHSNSQRSVLRMCIRSVRCYGYVVPQVQLKVPRVGTDGPRVWTNLSSCDGRRATWCGMGSHGGKMTLAFIFR